MIELFEFRNGGGPLGLQSVDVDVDVTRPLSNQLPEVLLSFEKSQ